MRVCYTLLYSTLREPFGGTFSSLGALSSYANATRIQGAVRCNILLFYDTNLLV